LGYDNSNEKNHLKSQLYWSEINKSFIFLDDFDVVFFHVAIFNWFIFFIGRTLLVMAFFLMIL
jgi:hypothetical protein